MKLNSQTFILDRMVQQWACRQRSYISGRPAECGHHHISREYLLTRWDIKNIIPLTLEEHRAVHDGSLSYVIINPFREQYLINQKNRNFKDFLLENGLTLAEFVKAKQAQWAERVRA